MGPLISYAVGDLVTELELSPLPDPPPERGVVVERDLEGRISARLLGPRPPGALVVDFRSQEFARRLAEGKRGLLGRATGLARGDRPLILDATAGLGRDAARLASLGATVIAFERNRVVRALFADGRRRGMDGDDDLATALRERLVIRGEDFCEASPFERDEKIDGVYLDPMFPARGSALAKKEAQLLQALLGEGSDANDDRQLFAAALALAPARIVVKRPRHAPPIVPSPDPNHRFEGKSVRYDLYLPAASASGGR